MSRKTVVIGAGPAGVACAYQLTKKNQKVKLFEAGNHIGGMARSFDLWGQKVDLGPHRFFSKQNEINGFFKEIIKDDYTMVSRQTRIYYNNRFFEYPLKLGNVLKNLSIITITQILWHYIIQLMFPIKNPKNFEEWVTNRFGKKLYGIFFKNYTEKLWGISCTKIDADWAAQRIKTLSLRGAVVAALIGNRGNKHKTLVDEFAYPKNGTGTLYEKAVEKIEQNNGEVSLNTPIKKVLLNDENSKVKGIVLTDGTIVDADFVVSSMPINLLIRGFENVPTNVKKAIDSLYFRNTILIYLEIDDKDLFTDNWLYIHSPDVQHGRITNFRNWSSSLYGDKETTIICMEYWCFEEDELWNQDEEKVINLAKEEIYKLNLISPGNKIINAKMVRVPRCYPVYETGYQERMKIVIDYLNGIEGLIPIGRYGAFKYNNQDHSILMGLLAADKIADNKQVDLWKINTDTEYQEEGKIKDVLIQ
ncbi:MAG TPA: FAD-dependent oxidoreductase [Bacteroidales bacterium]|nr:FAD-dependent oxidoreductase [Bacteroidales bacterium]